MSKIGEVSGRDLLMFVTRNGFRIVARRGSHVLLRKKNKAGEIRTVIPYHSLLAGCTVTYILNHCELKIDDFKHYMAMIVVSAI